MKKISLSLLLCSVSFLTTAHAMDDEQDKNPTAAPIKLQKSIESNSNVALTADDLLQKVQAKHVRAKLNENEKNDITRLYGEYVKAGKTTEAAQAFSNAMQTICEEGKTKELSHQERFHNMFAKDVQDILGLPESTNRAPLKRSMELNDENWKFIALKSTTLASEQEKLQSIFNEYDEKKDETLLLNALDGTINKGLKRHTAQEMKEAFFPEQARKDKEFGEEKIRKLTANAKNNRDLFSKNQAEFGIDTAIKNSKIIALQDSKTGAAPVEKFETKFEFTTETTAEAIRNLHQANAVGKIGVLDCANASTLGGGYRKGGNAQEEALMQVTNGYPVLTGIWPGNLFNGTIAVLEGVQLIKEAKANFEFELLSKEDRISFTMIAQAARNLNGYEMTKLSPEKQVKLRAQLQEETISYMEAQIRAFKESGCTDIILNAFGGGSFGNDNNAIAAEYIRILQSPEFKGAFRTVRFANPAKEINAEYETAFKKAFHEQVTTNLSGNSGHNINKN